MSISADFLRLEREYAQILDCVRAQMRAKPLPAVVSGMPPAVEHTFLSAFAADVKKEFGRGILIFARDDKSVLALTAFLRAQGVDACRFSGRELNIYNITASHENEHERLLVLSKILSGDCDAVVTTPAAAMGYTMPRQVLDRNRFTFALGDLLELSELVDALSQMGYRRVDTVDNVGQYAVRGGIVDVFPPQESDGERYPLRIEFFDTEIDRICAFDPLTQRLVENRESMQLLPVREVLYDKDGEDKMKRVIAECLKKAKTDDAIGELSAELAAIEGGQPLGFTDKYISFLYPQHECLLDYFPEQTAIAFCGTNAVREQIEAAARMDAQRITDLLEHGVIFGNHTSFSLPPAAFEERLAAHTVLHLNTFAVGLPGVRVSGLFSVRCRQLASYFKDYALLKEDLDGYIKNKYRILIACENDAEVKSLQSALVDDGYQAVALAESGADASSMLPGIVYLCREFIENSFEMTGAKLAALTMQNGESKFAPKKRKKSGKIKAGQAILSYADLAIGDYVVHAAYGIGQYLGIQNLTVGGVSRDYINIQYAGTDKLFLPVDNLDMVSKYIGAHSDDGLLKLSKMGGADWQKAKSRAKAAVRDMAKELIALYAKRLRTEGFAFPADDAMQHDFEAAFEYEETESQRVAAEEIKRDMMRPSPMDRLLCGDVGFGKTEVALRGAFKAIEAGKQVAILVPTTILALQHYHTATSRMRAFPVNVDMISRFRTQKQQKESLRALARGETDLIIGTHRLISQDVKFKDLGMLIVDEEQRFGVAQKEKLKQMAGNVDVLTLSATPIPRTLNMAMGGIRDMSILDEPPEDRLPVQTYVLEHDNVIICEAIRRELARGGQVFYLYNRVESIAYVAARLQRENPSAAVAVAHGKMEREEIEEIWQELIDGNIDILVCTTIIETGIDVPNANTLIIEDADRMGLAQLHQLRGRVGRSGRRAYAYFTYRRGKEISEIASKRLSAIREYAEFGAGFRIALRDLEIRGAGNLLGAQQHGHLDAVGYDMYIKLLNEAVLEEKGEELPVTLECKMDIPYDAYLPDTYIYASGGRMEMYKKIALIETEADLEDVADELIDRYGEFGKPVKNLLAISLARHMAQRAGANFVKIENGEIRIYSEKFDLAKWSSAAFALGNRIRFVSGTKTYISYRAKKEEDLLRVLIAIFKAYEAENDDGAAAEK
ncbi:MAG: transcription-repair coupling factor [Clostridia bacterium]|nr:transcription-repair coupling factor [Clostridia bacterium]